MDREQLGEEGVRRRPRDWRSEMGTWGGVGFKRCKLGRREGGWVVCSQLRRGLAVEVRAALDKRSQVSVAA